ncbi:MAG: CAP domain-containing protein [Proteobacteria bacterium]|nr:CAP domain-containing protein [Pseudomonadota bacterium]
MGRYENHSFGRRVAGIVGIIAVVILLFYLFSGRNPIQDPESPPGLTAKNATDSVRSTWGKNSQDASYQSSLPQQVVSQGDMQPHIPQEPLTKDAIIQLVNDTRAYHRYAPLTENQLLNAVAEERLRDMFRRQYIAHVSPIGEQASDYAQKAGYHYKIIAENLASGEFLNNQKVIDGWMQSPGHRQNILSPDIKDIGVAIDKGQFQGGITWIAVQIFGTPSLPVSGKLCTPPPKEIYAEIEAKKTGIENLGNRLVRFKQELDEEISSIESDRKSIGNKQAADNLNIRVKSYNEKSKWYNDSLADLIARKSILKAIIDDYNRRVQAYKDCRASGN